MSQAFEIRVCMDVGSQSHRVAIGLSTGKILEEFDISHTPKDIQLFFDKINHHEKHYRLPVVVAMESYNGQEHRVKYPQVTFKTNHHSFFN